MDLVTITCNEDIELCVYQLKSIHKYVEPCTVHVVINETDIKSAKISINKQKRRMIKHNVKIWSRNQVFKTKYTFKNGWVSQQLLKLLMPLDNDYVVLDCKDIFLKQTAIIDIVKLQYKKQPNLAECKTWGSFFNLIHRQLHNRYESKLKLVGGFNGIQTPRLIKKSVVLEIIKVWGSKKKFIKWWAGLKCLMSEFILYDYVAYCKNEKLPNNQRFKEHEIVSIWNMDMYNTNQEVDLNNIQEETRILKIHKRVFNNVEVKPILKKWLDKRLK
jgi:hypothetical protein